MIKPKSKRKLVANMFRPIRKKSNALDLAGTQDLLKTARRGVLALQGDEGYPYAIPLNFYYDQEAGQIYFHGARQGYKVDALQQSDKVCFTVCGPEIQKKEAWAPYVQSAVVFGRCHLVEDPDQALELLQRLALKYYPSADLVQEVIQKSGHAAQVFALTIEHLSGKEVQES